MAIVDRALIAVMGIGVVTAAVGGAWWVHQRHASGVVEAAVAQERGRLQGIHRAALDKANAQAQIEKTAALQAAMEAQNELEDARRAADRDRSIARTHSVGLHRTIAEFRDRAARESQGTSAGSLAHGAVATADALRECSERRSAVAEVADQLSVKVTGLQRYITDVVAPLCIGGDEGADVAFPVAFDQ